jgi:hypothetical protein
MTESSQNKQSRVLAALSGNPPHFDVRQRSEILNVLKRKGTPSSESQAESSAKKRADANHSGVATNQVEAESKCQ